MNYDGSIVIKAEVDAQKAEKDIKDLNKKVDDSAKKATGAKTIKFKADVSDVDKEMQKVQNKIASLEEKKLLAETHLSGVNAEKDALRDRIRTATMLEQNELAAQLTKEWDTLNGKSRGYEKTIADTNTKIDIQKDNFVQLAEASAESYRNVNGTKNVLESMEEKAKKFSLRLKEVLRSAIIFTVISQGAAKFRDWVGKVVKTNEEATQSVARLRGALLTLAQPLVETVLPAFTAIVNALSSIVYIVARLFSAVQGKTVEESAKAAENLNEEVDAIDGVGASAKKASKSLAAFDEINKLAGDSAASSSGGIKPDFSTADLNNLPKLLKNLVFDLEAKIRDLRFSWDEGTLASNQDAWIIALSGVLGAVLGSMFGGIQGGVIGLLLGLSVGIISCAFLDKTKNPDVVKTLFIAALSGVLGAALGAMFGGITGGVAGGVIGLLLGVLISITSIQFESGNAGNWDENDTLIVVLSSILGAILGATFGGLVGGVIGLVLGASISIAAISFSGDNFNQSEAIASLRIALSTIFGLILGATFGGLHGAVIGLILGMSIGFVSVAFDPTLESGVKESAKKALKVALNTIIGALVGAAIGGGIFGGIIGGAIALTFTLAINFASAKISDKTGLKNAISNYSSWTGKGFNVPGLATGAVVPPNREFMAVLGDNKRETEVVSPLSTMKQAMLEAMREYGGMGGSGGGDIVLQIDGKAFARVTNPYYKNENSRIGVKMVNGV